VMKSSEVRDLPATAHQEAAQWSLPHVFAAHHVNG
jgi:hypothetical protein